MAKTCLNKLSGNILQDCTIKPVGVKDIYLMHTEDVSFTYNGTYVSAATFVQGAKSYRLEGYKQNIQFIASLKTTDASAKLNTSVSFKIPLSGRSSLATLTTGKFCVMVHFVDGEASIVGLTSPLECSAMDFDSNANARLVTITLSDPEGSAGNYLTIASKPAKDTIISKSV